MAMMSSMIPIHNTMLSDIGKKQETIDGFMLINMINWIQNIIQDQVDGQSGEYLPISGMALFILSSKVNVISICNAMPMVQLMLKMQQLTLMHILIPFQWALIK